MSLAHTALLLLVALLALALRLGRGPVLADGSEARRRRRVLAGAERGQATAEYVLVLLGAASVALVLIGWLARSGRIEALLAQVFDRITAQL
jgi:hypothetical protein